MYSSYLYRKKIKNHTSWQWFPSRFCAAAPLLIEISIHWAGWTCIFGIRTTLDNNIYGNPWVLPGQTLEFSSGFNERKIENPFTMMYGYFHSLKKPGFRHAAFGKPSENWAESMAIHRWRRFAQLQALKAWASGLFWVRVIVKQITRPDHEYAVTFEYNRILPEICRGFITRFYVCELILLLLFFFLCSHVGNEGLLIRKLAINTVNHFLFPTWLGGLQIDMFPEMLLKFWWT